MKLSTQYTTWRAAPFLLFALLIAACFTSLEAAAQTDPDPVFMEVDEMPKPKGGMEGWNSYLAQNMKYPKEARDTKVEGTVVIAFVVLENGEISTPEILRGIGNGCDEEVLRLVKESPIWTPGKKDGKVVKTRMRLPVRFKL